MGRFHAVDPQLSLCRCITMVALFGLHFKLNICPYRRASCSTASPRALNRKWFIYLHQPTAQNRTMRIATGGWRAGFFCCETVFLPSFCLVYSQNASAIPVATRFIEYPHGCPAYHPSFRISCSSWNNVQSTCH